VTSGLADVWYARQVPAARGLRENIRHALRDAPAAQVEAAARRAYRVLLLNYYDLFCLPRLTLAQLHRIVQLEGWEQVWSAHALGRGVLLCSAHLGNVEAGLHIIAANGLPVVGPVEHIQPERLFHYLTRLRTCHGLRLVPTDGAMIELFRALKRGELLGTTLDRDTTGSGVEVTVCGARARVPDGYAQIAAKLRTPLVMGFCYRLPGGRARTEMGPVYVPALSARREDVYREALEFGVRELERGITAHPDQWVLTTPLWI